MPMLARRVFRRVSQTSGSRLQLFGTTNPCFHGLLFNNVSLALQLRWQCYTFERQSRRALFNDLHTPSMKRKASPIVISDSDEEDTITLARPAEHERSVRRKILHDADVSQAQNGRSRTLECVLIPRLNQASLLNRRPVATQQRWTSHSATSTPGSNAALHIRSTRPKPATALQSFVRGTMTDSDDELTSAPITVGRKRRSNKPIVVELSLIHI